jgi:hypothetical protein
MAVKTSKVTGRRRLHFESLDEVLAEAERLAARPYRKLGNWTLGQILMHLALAGEKSIDGTIAGRAWLFIKGAGGKLTRPRWFVRLAAKPFSLFVQWYLRRWGPPPGIRPPACFWKELAPITPGEGLRDEEGVAAYRRAIGRLKTESPRDLEGIMTAETFNLYHLRHAEMHLSFILPEGFEGKTGEVIQPSTTARLVIGIDNTFNRCLDLLSNLLHWRGDRAPASRTPQSDRTVTQRFRSGEGRSTPQRSVSGVGRQPPRREAPTSRSDQDKP